MRPGYDTAQVCLNGHVVTSMSQSFPGTHAQVLREVRRASDYRLPDLPSIDPGPLPQQTWTEQRLEAARELTNEAEHLSGEEKQQLADSFDDLTRDTPRTQVAAGRFKRLVAKAGIETGNALRVILVDVMSEAAKKAIWGPGA
jgi:hypothetical protein